MSVYTAPAAEREVQVKSAALPHMTQTFQHPRATGAFLSTLSETREERDMIKQHPQISRGKESSNDGMVGEAGWEQGSRAGD